MISIETIQLGFAKTTTPGRMEVVSQRPRVVLSGDHNTAGIEYLIQTLATQKNNSVVNQAGSVENYACSEPTGLSKRSPIHIDISSLIKAPSHYLGVNRGLKFQMASLKANGKFYASTL